MKTCQARYHLYSLACSVLAGIMLAACVSAPAARYADLKISAEGPDTLLKLDDSRVLLANTVWSRDSTRMKIQVGGPTASATAPRPDLDYGDPGYVHSSYDGFGVNTLEVADRRLMIRDLGDQWEINTGDYVYKLRKGRGVKVEFMGGAAGAPAVRGDY